MTGRTYSVSEHISKHLSHKRFRLQPRFTIVHHPVRRRFGLSLTTYSVIDSIHQLSHRPDHPWCSQSKSEIAKFLDVSERQVFRAVKEGLEKELLAKNDRGDLRTTEKWINEVVLYDAKKSHSLWQNVRDYDTPNNSMTNCRFDYDNVS